MKKIFALLIFFAIPLVSVGASSPDSSVSSGGYGYSLDTGVANYSDVQYVECTDDISDCTTLISTTTPYTILSYAIFQGGDTSSYLYCGEGNPDEVLAGYKYAFVASDLGLVPYSFTSNAQFHCSDSLYLSSGSANDYIYVEYVPYDTRMISSTSTMPLEDTHFGIIAEFAFAFAAFWLVLWIFKRKI